jgi:uncharacterized protein YllA (UPF0747 family)
MLKFTKEGIEYNDKLYAISKSDQEWIKEENKKVPNAHPARNLRSLATVIVELD